MSEVATSPASAAPRRAGATRGDGPGRVVLALAGALSAAVLLGQIPIAIGLLHPGIVFEADHTKRVLVVNALAAAATVLAAAVLPRRLRALALAPGALLAALMVGAAATAGGHLWDYGTAALTLLAAWWAGRIVVRALRVPALEDVAIVELAIGLGLAGLLVLLLGRLHALAWWSVGAATIALGVAGAVTATRASWARRDALAGALLDSPVAAACAGLLLLQVAWATVWLSAPEIQYDALYAKAYLPQLWAHTGSIGPLLTHPVLNVTGLAQFLAVGGHALGAPDVGRELEMLTWGVLVATVWWYGRRSVAGPLAALAVGVAPHVVWQATTAYDDLLLSLGAVALAVAVLRTADADAPSGGRPFATALAIGLIGGAAVWLKLNQLAVAGVLLAGWVALARPARDLRRRAAGVALGVFVVAGLAIALRWIDTGNPLFPAYNTIFKSPDYPLVNEQYNFPFWQHPGFWNTVKAPYLAIVRPWLMSDSIAQGGLGLLVAAGAIATLAGWRYRDRRGVAIAWLALMLGLLAWWVQFRYLRYALPTMLVGVLLVTWLLRGWRPGRVATLALLGAAALASALYLPSTVASFWNVPHRNVPFGAAFGHWSRNDYLRTALPEKDVLDAYQRVAPSGADAVSEAHERTFLTDRDLSPFWEVTRLMQARGPLPLTSDATLRELRGMGIGWAIVAASDPSHESGWAAAVLAAHGELVFSDRGWQLYRLVDRPARPRWVSCDVRLRGLPGCWTGTFDRRPGLADGESAGGARRSIAVCPGQTLLVELSAAPGGADPSQAWIDSDSGAALSGHATGTVSTGETGEISDTAPPGTHTMTVTLAAGVHGGLITTARVGVLGRCSVP